MKRTGPLATEDESLSRPIFISYASADRKKAEAVCKAIENRGLVCWISCRDVGPGENYQESIVAAIRLARAMVLIFSQAANKSDEIKKEISLASRNRCPVIAVRLEDVEPSDALAYEFSTRQWIDAFPGWGRSLDALITKINQMTEGAGADHSSPRTWAFPPGMHVKKNSLLVILASIVLIGLAGSLWHARQTTIQPAVANETRSAPPNSVAVLAFANLSGDPKQDYFSDGLSEEVLDALANVRQLQVAARTSSFSFKNKSADVGTIGSRLGVAYVLDGSVRRDGDLVRVNASLVNTKTGFKTWSETYDRKLNDIFAVQQSIASAVASALQVRLSGESPQSASGGTSNTVAYDEYLKGRQLVDLSASEEEWRSALARFDAALVADPAFANAHAGRARALIALANAFLPAEQLRPTYGAALQSARRAVELAPDSSEAQSTLGYALVYSKLDFSAADAPFQKSLELGGGEADVLIRYGIFATRTGKTTAGLNALRHALSLDPLNPRAYKSLALGLYAAHDYDASIATMRRALALSPKMTLAHSVIGDGLLMRGDVVAATAEYQAEPIAWAKLTGMAIVAARHNRQAEAGALLDQLVRKYGDSNVYQQAEIEAQLGNINGSIGALRRAREVGDVGLFSVWTDPLLQPLRKSDLFKSFLTNLSTSRALP